MTTPTDPRGWIPGTRAIEIDELPDATASTEERRPYFAGPMADPEALAAVCHHVQNEYGYTGYRIGIEGAAGDVSAIVRCSDGSEFRLLADRWGNVETPADDSQRAIIDAIGRLAARS